MSKLELNMTGIEMISAMSQGNPGAMTVLLHSLKMGGLVDPSSAFGGFTFMMLLDNDEIYASEIWLLFKDVCKENYPAAHGLLRARQMGLVDISTIKSAMQNYGRGIDVEAILIKLLDALPDFNLDPKLPNDKAVNA